MLISEFLLMRLLFNNLIRFNVSGAGMSAIENCWMRANLDAIRGFVARFGTNFQRESTGKLQKC
jgi:hypothetical protein